MAFERFERLGTEKFQTIVNQIVRGTPAVMVARLIQQEWGDCLDTAEHSLAKQLTRLKTAVTNGAFGGDLAEQARRRASVRIKLFHQSNIDCLDALTELANLEEDRLKWLMEKERLSGKRSAAVQRDAMGYLKVLEAIQKIRFDLGIDEYKFGIPKNLNSTPQDPLETQKQIIRAWEVAEEVFADMKKARDIGNSLE